MENKLDIKEWPHQSESPAVWNGSGAVRWVVLSQHTIGALIVSGNNSAENGLYC